MSLLETEMVQKTLSKEDFVSDQTVRWCPGCGDYAILASMQKILPELGIKREEMVFVSGIGCSSRFPYYLDTYGFHTIHGRAPTIATGLKIVRPELCVWVITGDGDGLSIGANHLLHIMRRNVDVTILLFNNRIYGLTKGQYSPTSEQGKKTKTSPMGSLEMPLDPIQVALAADCSFVARAIDVDAKGLQWVLKEAARHPGTAFVEIYQNCNVFNDGAFSHVSAKELRAQNTLSLTPGKPLLFGQNNEKGLCYQAGGFKVVSSQSNEVFVHEANLPIEKAIALNALSYPQFPLPLGIFRAALRPVYEKQIEKTSGVPQTQKKLEALLHSGKTWEIK